MFSENFGAIGKACLLHISTKIIWLIGTQNSRIYSPSTPGFLFEEGPTTSKLADFSEEWSELAQTKKVILSVKTKLVEIRATTFMVSKYCQIN